LNHRAGLFFAFSGVLRHIINHSLEIFSVFVSCVVSSETNKQTNKQHKLKRSTIKRILFSACLTVATRTIMAAKAALSPLPVRCTALQRRPSLLVPPASPL
jgi:hypothetical protein